MNEYSTPNVLDNEWNPELESIVHTPYVTRMT